MSGHRPPPVEHVPTALELQRAIASVTGVTGAEVTRGDNGRDRLRISLAPGEDPEAVGWSVAATLRERFQIALDPAAITARVIEHAAEQPAPAHDAAANDPSRSGEAASGAERSAALTAPVSATSPSSVDPVSAESGSQAADELVSAARTALGSDAPSSPGAPDAAGSSGHTRLVPRQRAAIRELTARPDGDDLDVAATLALPDREVVGHARGVRTRRGRWRAIAEATLAALDLLTVGKAHGHVDHVTVLTFADLAHVSVSVTLLTEHGEETFLGAALVRDDPDRAVMRAALDAVNRRIEPWLADVAAEAG